MGYNFPTHLENSGFNSAASISAQKWGALIGGGALAIYGLTRRSPLGVALAAGGGTIAVLGATRAAQSHSEPLTSTSVLINCTPEEAYRFWRDFNNLPRFMSRVQTMNVLDDRSARWTVIGPAGRIIDWETEIVDDRENEYISWRSVPESDIQVAGCVKFRQAPAGRGTLIRARVKFGESSGSNSITRFLSRGANFMLRQDLRRMEALMETGEIPTVEGQSHGSRSAATGILRVADPTRPIPPKSTVSDMFDERRRSA